MVTYLLGQKYFFALRKTSAVPFLLLKIISVKAVNTPRVKFIYFNKITNTIYLQILQKIKLHFIRIID